MSINKSMRGIVRGAVFAAAAIGLTSSAAQAVVVLNETFDTYTDGNLVGQGGWNQTGNTTTNAIQVAGTADKHAALVNTGQDAYSAFDAGVAHVDGDSLATSTEVTVSAASVTGDYFLHLSDPVGSSSNFYQRLFARSSGDGYQLGLLASSGTGSATSWGTDVLSFGTTYDVDIDWNFVEGTQNDTFALAVNGTQYLTHTWNSTSVQEPAAISAANLRQGGSTTGPTVQVDAIMIDGDTLVPEPGSLSLAAAGAVMALRRRRR